MNFICLVLSVPVFIAVVYYLSEGSLPNCIYKCHADLKKKRLRQKVESAFDCCGGSLIHHLDLHTIQTVRNSNLEARIKKLEERGSI